MNHVTKVAVVVAAICALSVSAAAPKWHELSMQYTYDDYLRDFDKMQLRKRDYAARKRTFEAELQFVVQHNADPTATFKRNVNKFSDWTRSELQHLRMHSDFEGAIGSRAEAAISPTRRQASRTGFDWRSVTPPVMTTVKDQGGCGSCWAHATTEAVESQVAINTGKLFAFSQQQLVSCVPFVAAHFLNRTVIEGGCGGYMPNLAIDAIVGAPFNGGFAEEWENPYRDYWTGLAPYDSLPNMTTNAKCDGWMSAIPRPLGVVTGYDWVKSNDAEAFEDALINKGPIVVIMAVFSDLYSYDSGLYSSPQCEGKNGTLPPSHAVNLVGFGHDEGAKADYWIIRNSWSAAWGEAGYARLLRRPRDACTTMFLPQSDFSNLTNWAPLPACGMCGLLAFGLVPRT